MQVLIQPYGKSEISLSFPSGFTEPVLNAVRRLPNRRYDPSQRIWIIPDSQECIDSLLQNLYLTGLFTYENVNENQNYPENTNDELINDYVQKETKKLEEVLTVRHYSKCTIERYKKWVQLFLTQNSASESKCYNQSAQKEINEYLKFLALKKNVSASTQNQALAALLFYYRFVKNEPM